ncbi:MAG: hypothetical protein ACKN9W_18170 [Methylococcus sp.]
MSNQSSASIPVSVGISIVTVLILLYLALVLRDWKTMEELRGMIIPFIIFGVFAGLSLSIVPWVAHASDKKKLAMLTLTSAAIALIAISAQTALLAGKLPYSNKSYTVSTEIDCKVYIAVGFCSVITFSIISNLGYALTVPLRKSALTLKYLDKFGLKDHSDLLVAAFGLIAAVVTAFAKSGA